MIKIAVVDDEKMMLEKICRIIDEQFIEEKIIRSFDKSVNFFNDPDKYNFDLVFLDIDMPELNGFDLAENLKLIKPSITVIFVSRFEYLVFKSFMFSPFRFIRKDFLENETKKAITDYLILLRKNTNMFHIITSDFERDIPISDIMYFESFKHDIYVHSTNGRYKLKRNRDNEASIKALANCFELSGFIRVHKSYLVNYNYIHVINRNSVILKNNFSIYINPHNVNDIKLNYQKMLILEE
ncbi:MAG: response regulator transcription factor [Ruminococcus sp.]|nr:response regulator transcription factor [Ruminococcus sp.]